MFTTTIANTKKPSPISYKYQNFLWHNDRKLYWPDNSEIRPICWNNNNNNSCQVMLHYINAIQESAWNEKYRERYQTRLTENKEKLAIINTSKDNLQHDIIDKSMVNMQQTAAINSLLQAIQEDENNLAKLPTDIVPVNFPIEGTQKDKDAFKDAVFKLLPYNEEDKVKEVAILKSVLERARKRKLYEPR